MKATRAYSPQYSTDGEGNKIEKVANKAQEIIEGNDVTEEIKHRAVG